MNLERIMKRLPVDVSNFELMITGNYLYIDKTKNIYELITNARLFFLSRPRRFGKSLLISTLKELFSGVLQNVLIKILSYFFQLLLCFFVFDLLNK